MRFAQGVPHMSTVSCCYSCESVYLECGISIINQTMYFDLASTLKTRVSYLSYSLLCSIRAARGCVTGACFSGLQAHIAHISLHWTAVLKPQELKYVLLAPDTIDRSSLIPIAVSSYYTRVQ